MSAILKADRLDVVGMNVILVSNQSITNKHLNDYSISKNILQMFQ